LAKRTRVAGGPDIAINDGEVSLSAALRLGLPADVWLVRYDPRVIETPVRAGENAGRTLPHKNVVRALVHLGSWSGRPARFSLPKRNDGLAAAILVQAPDGGPILAASKV
jgi:hypothetical protein